MADKIPELLFHTVLTVINFHEDTSGSTQVVYVLGTHTTLPAAKSFSLDALHLLGYERDDFLQYDSQADRPPTPPDSDSTWPHGDGVMVYTKAPAGQEFLVSIDTKSNTESLSEGPEHTLLLPQGHDHLHYVLQTKTDYNQDKSGAYQTTEIEGCFARRKDAERVARGLLVDEAEGRGRDGYTQYDERDSEEEKGQWPFGEGVLVHAVGEAGENYSVSVRTSPGARRRFGKKR